MNLSKSIDFLLENAGPVIQYRLRKEILKNITQIEEEKLLEQVYETPNFKLVQSYVKPNERTFLESAKWSGAYNDVFLESDLKRKYALECDLTFWAVQFLCLVNEVD